MLAAGLPAHHQPRRTRPRPYRRHLRPHPARHRRHARPHPCGRRRPHPGRTAAPAHHGDPGVPRAPGHHGGVPAPAPRRGLRAARGPRLPPRLLTQPRRPGQPRLTAPPTPPRSSAASPPPAPSRPPPSTAGSPTRWYARVDRAKRRPCSSWRPTTVTSTSPSSTKWPSSATTWASTCGTSSAAPRPSRSASRPSARAPESAATAVPQDLGGPFTPLPADGGTGPAGQRPHAPVRRPARRHTPQRARQVGPRRTRTPPRRHLQARPRRPTGHPRRARSPSA